MEEEEPVVEERNEPEPEPELGLEPVDGSPEEYGIFSGSKGESDGKFHGEEELTEIPQYDSKEKGNNSNENRMDSDIFFRTKIKNSRHFIDNLIIWCSYKENPGPGILNCSKKYSCHSKSGFFQIFQIWKGFDFLKSYHLIS